MKACAMLAASRFSMRQERKFALISLSIGSIGNLASFLDAVKTSDSDHVRTNKAGVKNKFAHFHAAGGEAGGKVIVGNSDSAYAKSAYTKA